MLLAIPRKILAQSDPDAVDRGIEGAHGTKDYEGRCTEGEAGRIQDGRQWQRHSSNPMSRALKRRVGLRHPLAHKAKVPVGSPVTVIIEGRSETDPVQLVRAATRIRFEVRYEAEDSESAGAGLDPRGIRTSRTTLRVRKAAPPWAASSMNFSQSVSLISFDRSAELDYNPYYALTLDWPRIGGGIRNCTPRRA